MYKYVYNSYVLIDLLTTHTHTHTHTCYWEKYHLKYADDTSLLAENEEELNKLLVRLKEESEKASLKLTIQKLKSWHLIPSFHGK